MTDLLEKAMAEVGKLSPDEQDMLANWILEKISSPDFKTEEEWEEEVLEETLGPFMNPNGSIDFDRLEANGKYIELNDLYAEGDEDIE